MSDDRVSAAFGRVETPDGRPSVQLARRAADRADEDAAAVVVVLAAMTARTAAEPARARTVWGSPAHRLQITVPGRHGWWASGLPS